MQLIDFYPLRSYLKEVENRTILNKAMESVLDEDSLINGEHVKTFQEEFARYTGAKYCIGTGNGYDSLTLALRSLAVSTNDEVIVPAFTFIATWFCVEAVSATPIPCDVNELGQLDLEKCKSKINSRTRAVIFVHLYGIATDLSEFAKYLKERDILLIEDCAQATGARINGKHVGTFGEIGCFSFYPTKNLGALGDGGAVITNRLDLAEAIDSIRNFGAVGSKYNHEKTGVNSRLDTLQAAWLISKLKTLDQENDKRKKIANEIKSALIDSNHLRTLNRDYNEVASDVFHLFIVQSLEGRDKTILKLKNLAVGSDCHYPKAIVEQKVYEFRGFEIQDFPNALELAQTVLSLPLYPWMPSKVIDMLCSRLKLL